VAFDDPESSPFGAGFERRAFDRVDAGERRRFGGKRELELGERRCRSPGVDEHPLTVVQHFA
jgi:hypothetical protein